MPYDPVTPTPSVKRAEYVGLVEATQHCEYMSQWHRRHYATDWQVRYVPSLYLSHYVYVVVCRHYSDDIEEYARIFPWQQQADRVSRVRSAVKMGEESGAFRTDPIDATAQA